MEDTKIILISLAVAAIAITITKSSLFRGLRELLPWKLFNCPYCLSHWISLLFCLYYYPLNVDFIINVFAIVTLSSFSGYLLLHFLGKSDETIHDS